MGESGRSRGRGTYDKNILYALYEILNEVKKKRIKKLFPVTLDCQVGCQLGLLLALLSFLGNDLVLGPVPVVLPTLAIITLEVWL